MSLKGKVAVVTGGGRGIGRAICQRLARDGAAVAIWELNEADANETLQLLESAGHSAIACIGDAADAASVKRCADETRAALGEVNILVNNAGISAFEKFLAISEEAWDRMMRINLKGPFLCTQQFLPSMMKSGWGRIINISSSSAQTGAKSMTHYVASKGGVIGFTKGLAIELADTGVTVNNVPPGFVVTPMLEESPVDIDGYAQTMPMKRPGKPEDIAGAVAYLASDEANYITGHTLSVNGGRYLN